MFALSLDYKYYPFIAIPVGYFLGDIIGAVASFLFVKSIFLLMKMKFHMS